jgi:hypothetical protein
MQKSNKVIRNKPNQFVEDVGSIEDSSYNETAGARKVVDVGPYLLPLDDGAGGKTTDASAIRALQLGVQLYLYNNSGVVASARFSNSSSATALTPGAVDGATGDVGVPLPPNSYTKLTNYTNRYLITSASTVIVMKVQDGSRLVDQGTSEGT